MAKGRVSQGELMLMSALSVLIPAMLLVGALTFIAFYANGYSLFQKLVLLLVALIVVGVLEALLWLVWAGKKGLLGWPRPK
jgi:hypothetical protein